MKYLLLLLISANVHAQTVTIEPGFTVGNWVQSGEFFSNKESVYTAEIFSMGKRYVIQYHDEHPVDRILQARKWLRVIKEPGYCQINDFCRGICAQKPKYMDLVKNYRIIIMKQPTDSVYTNIRIKKIIR